MEFVSVRAGRCAREVVGGGGWRIALQESRVGRVRLGCNYGPGRGPSGVFVTSNESLPIAILGNEPNCVGFLSTLGDCRLMGRLRSTVNLPTTTSFGRIDPTNTTINLPLSSALEGVC